MTVTADPMGDCPDTSKTVQCATGYLQSPKRVERFAFVPKAGIAIAKALDAGKFGPVDRYDAWKRNLKHGETGWGGISAKNGDAFAWVYWNKGKIDYTKPVTQITIAGTTDDSASVTIFGPDKETNYWQVSQPDGTGATQVTDLYGFETGNDSSSRYYTYPTTLGQLRRLDNSAIAQAQAALVAQFGTNWNN